MACPRTARVGKGGQENVVFGRDRPHRQGSVAGGDDWQSPSGRAGPAAQSPVALPPGRGRRGARQPLATLRGSDYTGGGMTHAPRLVRSCLLAASLALAACGSDNHPKPADAGAPDPGKEPVVGGKLGAAIASAAAQSTAAPVKAKAQDGDQPPENGIFPPGEAEKRQPKDGPPKIDVMSDGDGAKVQLAYKLDAAEVKTTITAGLRMGQGRLPSIDFALSIKPDKPKEKAGDKPKDKPADAPGGAAAPVHLVATVTGATLPGSQGAPKDAVDEIAKLKGATIKYDLTAAGQTSNFVIDVPKGAQEGLRPVLEALANAISLFTVALPPKPVGLGAYWIAAERAKGDAGLDVLRFRVFKILKIEGDVVTFSMDVRQYSADQKVKLQDQGGEQELVLNAFESKGTGALIWKADSFLAQKGDATQDMSARVTPPGQPPAQPGQRPQGLMLQSQVTASLGGGTGMTAKPPQP